MYEIKDEHWVTSLFNSSGSGLRVCGGNRGERLGCRVVWRSEIPWAFMKAR